MTRALGCFLLSACFALAQQIDHSAPNSAPAPNVTAANIIVRGCVQGRTKGHFTLFQTSTGATFEMQGDVRAFRRSTGKLVDVKATELAPTSGQGAASLPHLKVSNLLVIADKCPIQGNGRNSTQPNTNHSADETAPSAETPRYQRSGAPDQTPPTAGTNPNGAGVSGAPSPGTGNPPK